MPLVRRFLCMGLVAGMLGCSSSLQTLSVTAVSPATVLAGSTAALLTVTGTQFNTHITVALNGTLLPTTFVSPTTLMAQVPATLPVGTYAVSLVEDDGGVVPTATLASSLSVQVVTVLKK